MFAMRRQSMGALGCALAIVCCTGCGGSKSYNRYIPAEPAARQALEAVLAGWQEDRPPELPASLSCRLQVVDSHRRQGQKLTGFDVLGEVPWGEGPRCFAVRLVLDNPAEVQKTRFCVIGIDPIWVIREEEYEMITHWECFEPRKTDNNKLTRGNNR